jgi:hypothetical protein
MKKKPIIIISLSLIFIISLFLFKDDTIIEISHNITEDDITEDDITKNNDDEINLEINNKVIGHFNRLLSLNPNETELLEFIYLEDDYINDNTFSKLLMKFIDFQFTNLSIHDQMIQNENIQTSLLDEYGCNNKITNLNQLNDIQLKNRLSSLYSRGYLINFDNGKFHLEIDYNFFKKYENRQNDEIKNYIQIKNNTYYPYESIRIQWQYVFNNIYLSEKFLNEYDQSLLYYDIYSIYINNVDCLLYGTDYINIFDGKNKLNIDIQEQYKKIVLDKNNIFFTNIFSSYYNELINSEFILNSNIIHKRETLFSIIKEKYKKK